MQHEINKEKTITFPHRVIRSSQTPHANQPPPRKSHSHEATCGRSISCHRTVRVYLHRRASCSTSLARESELAPPLPRRASRAVRIDAIFRRELGLAVRRTARRKTYFAGEIAFGVFRRRRRSDWEFRAENFADFGRTRNSDG